MAIIYLLNIYLTDPLILLRFSPDLPERIRNGQPFTPYNRDTFYTPGPVGYIDYAVYGERGHGEEAAEQKAAKAKLA